MDSGDLRQRLADSSVAVLATVSADGSPHAVPICFALDGSVMYFAIDHKPKRTAGLKRLHNIASNPSVAVLVEHYEHDWNRLWWVRVDGKAHVVGDREEFARAIELLVDRYMQYRGQEPQGPVVAIAIERISGWSASP
jgi:PPOX class probable F420-dependent enzyme